MPRFYFHLFNDLTTQDDEGLELPSAAVAMRRAAVSAREMAAQSVREGRLILDHRVEVTDEDRDTIGAVRFSDVAEIWTSSGGS